MSVRRNLPDDARIAVVDTSDDVVAEVLRTVPPDLAARISRSHHLDRAVIEVPLRLLDQARAGLPAALADRLDRYLDRQRPGAPVAEADLDRLDDLLPDELAQRWAAWRRTGRAAGAALPGDLRVALVAALARSGIGHGEHALGSGGFVYPVCKVTKSVSPTTIGSGEYATVTITVDGAEAKQSVPVPKSVVITLDESGSMQGRTGDSRAAAVAVVNALQGADKVALVTFSDTAVVRVPLTTDHQAVLTAVQGLDSPEGQTNMLDAFTTSNALLLNDVTAYNKLVILFSDGMPTPLTQIDDIKAQLDVPRNGNIHYFCVGYLVKLGLQDLAEETGGQFYEATQTSQLTTYFTAALAEMTDILRVRNVVVHEVLTADMSIRPGSFNYSQSMGSESAAFTAAVEQAKQAFYASGTLHLPTIPLLDQGRNVTIHFDVTAHGCQREINLRDVNDTKHSYVEYSVGNQTVIPMAMPPAQIAVRACGVYVDKRFDASTSRVVVEIRNTFPDRKVYDVRVAEMTGPDVGIDSGTMQPQWPVGGIYYPPWCENVWTDWGVDWRWSAIEPDSTQTFSVVVFARESAKGKRPVVINPAAEPDVVDIDSTLPEPKHYGYVEYRFQDDQGTWVSRHQDLPEYTVVSFEPTWPYV